MRRITAAALIAIALAAAGCGGGDDTATEATTSTTAEASTTTSTTEAETTTTTEAEETTTTATTEPPLDPLPVGQIYGVDDYDDNHVPDAMCEPHDFGAGLVLLRYCDLEGYSGQPADGVTLVDGSLFSWPTRNDSFLMDGISGDAIIALDESLSRVIVIVFNSDGLFATGSADILSPDTFTNLIARINSDAPGARIQVRGHTDSTGSPDANQALSDRRAETVRAFLVDNGVQAAEVTAVGLGQNAPIAIEDNDNGRSMNRRVEVVIRPVETVGVGNCC